MGPYGRERSPGLAFFQKFGLVFDSQKRPVGGRGEASLYPSNGPRPGLPLATCFETACLSPSTRQLLKVTGLSLRVQGLHPVLYILGPSHTVP